MCVHTAQLEESIPTQKLRFLCEVLNLPKDPKVLLFNLMPTQNMEATGEAFFFPGTLPDFSARIGTLLSLVKWVIEVK